MYTDSLAFIPVTFLSLFELMAAGVVGAEALLPVGEERGRVQADCMLPAQAYVDDDKLAFTEGDR